MQLMINLFPRSFLKRAGDFFVPLFPGKRCETRILDITRKRVFHRKDLSPCLTLGLSISEIVLPASSRSRLVGREKGERNDSERSSSKNNNPIPCLEQGSRYYKSDRLSSQDPRSKRPRKKDRGVKKGQK